MEKQDVVQYWIDSSNDNYESMLRIFNAGEYMWALFIGHLSTEKLLKAYYVKLKDSEVPRTHDLYKLAVFSGINLTDEQKDDLQYITLFNIESRYEEYKKDFYKKCTKKFALENIEKIKRLRAWLLEMIQS